MCLIILGLSNTYTYESDMKHFYHRATLYMTLLLSPDYGVQMEMYIVFLTHLVNSFLTDKIKNILHAHFQIRLHIVKNSKWIYSAIHGWLPRKRILSVLVEILCSLHFINIYFTCITITI